jgi:hypothetical protein
VAGKSQREWKSPIFEGTCPKDTDWARLAAFIDGEGSILINTRSTKDRISAGFYLRITVANTDVRLPVWLKETFGGSYKDANTAAYYVGQNWKRCYHWGTCSHRAAWILHNCLPYFIIKRDQAEIGISLQESMAKFTRGPGKELPFDLVEERKQLKQELLTLKRRGVTSVTDNVTV